MNGIVLEIGRKIRTPEQEAEGVLTYSAMLGAKKATYLWILTIAITLILSIAAANYAGFGQVTFYVLIGFFLFCTIVALYFLKNQNAKSAKAIEIASAIWTIAMYLTLGGVPMLLKI
jgi:4-hydroxybenzoate polyprenyltransferase